MAAKRLNEIVRGWVNYFRVADLMRRSSGHDPRSCPKCGGTMELLEIVLEHARSVSS
jgi:hypothetical protein